MLEKLLEGEVAVLVHLSIKGFAIIDALELSFGPGMTVLTGETGAGKSIVIDALTLVIGGRASADVIRAGEEQAELAAQFALDGATADRVAQALEEAGLVGCDDGALVVRRVLTRAGRHRQFINGSLATAGQLKEIVAPLIDFTGQHASQALLRPGSALALVDGFGGHGAALKKIEASFGRARGLEMAMNDLRNRESEKVQRAEWLRFQIDEIDAVAPEAGELERLQGERSRLRNVEQLRLGLARALESLVDGDLVGNESGNALSRVQNAAREVARFAEDDAVLRRANEELEEAAALIDDVSRTLSRTAEQLAEDPERLEAAEERIDATIRLTRKHGGSVEAVLAAHEKMEEEFESLENASERLEQMRTDLEAEVLTLGTAALALRKKRKTASRKLCRAIESELDDLGMAGARLEMRLEALPVTAESPLVVGTGSQRSGLGQKGADRGEFFLSANPGEPLGPLSKVASGGELSRVLLGVKRVLLRNDPCPLSIFDEVDAGVGGAIGEVIGDKLKAVAAGRQVICVTHLPQIAAQGDAHLRVEKQTESSGGAERTVASLKLLNDKARVEELSRMLGGKKITARTRAHAREMLEHAG